MTHDDDLALARERIVGCDMRSREHRESWKRWRARAIAFQITLAAVSAVAGSALLAGAKEGSTAAIVIGVLAIVGAVLTATSEALSPSKTAEEHRRAAIRFSALGVAFNTFVRTSHDDDDAHSQFQALDGEHLAAVKEGPEPEQWAVGRAGAGGD